MTNVDPLSKVVFSGKEGGSGTVTSKVVPKSLWDLESENRAASETSRKQFAKEAGLPEDASWDQINKVGSEASRKQYAKEAGLPEDASWGQINKAMDKN